MSIKTLSSTLLAQVRAELPTGVHVNEHVIKQSWMDKLMAMAALVPSKDVSSAELPNANPTMKVCKKGTPNIYVIVKRLDWKCDCGGNHSTSTVETSPVTGLPVNIYSVYVRDGYAIAMLSFHS
jgi:hypothetical protein